MAYSVNPNQYYTAPKDEVWSWFRLFNEAYSIDIYDKYGCQLFWSLNWKTYLTPGRRQSKT